MAIIKKGLGSLIPPQGGGRRVQAPVGTIMPLPPGPIPRDPWGPGGCPHPEEEILLADDSWIKAKDIKTCDKVKTLTAKDFKEGEYEITRAEIIDNQPRCEVFFKDSKSIISSYSHPYAVEDKGFVEAQDIKVGDTVGDLIVTEVKPLDWGSVVSLSVDEAETYMLKGGSEDKPVAVLSHNKTPLPDRPPGTSLADRIRRLQMQKQRLAAQLRRIEIQLQQLMSGGGRPPWEGPEPPRPTPFPGNGDRGITVPAPTPVGPGTPIPQPPPIPPGPKPPWGG